MRQFVNTNLVRRNDYFGRGLMALGLFMVLGGFLYSFVDPDAFVELSFVLLMGIVLSQFGLMTYSRWGIKPRNFEVLGSELRGFSDHHLLIHFALGGRHIFACSGGIFNLIPLRESGEVYNIDGTPTIVTPSRGLLKRSRRKKLAKFISAAIKEAHVISKSIGGILETDEPLRVQPIIAFLADDATIVDEIETPRFVHLKQLKAELKKSCKSGRMLADDQIKAIIDHIV